MGPIVNQSQDPPRDALTGDGPCGTHNDLQVPSRPAGSLRRTARACHCSWSRRSPRRTSSTTRSTDQTSVVRFIEDNWLGGRGSATFSDDSKAGTLANMFAFQPVGPVGHNRLFLDPTSGEPVGHW